MSAESGWLGISVGASVGTLAWVVGLGKVLSPHHPNWALFLIILVVAIVSMAILESNDRRTNNRAQI